MSTAMKEMLTSKSARNKRSMKKLVLRGAYAGRPWCC
jgi:hypothetical protein